MNDFLWNTIGHPGVKEILQKQLRTGRLSSAYAFVGPEGVGKRTFADEFSREILQISPQKSPDFSSFDGKEGDIETLRSFISKTTYAPVQSNFTVAIIDNANYLDASAHSALLKTLEEPHPRSIFILITHTRSLPETIFSRCQVYSFYSLSDAHLSKVFTLEEEDLVSTLSPWAGGSAGKLRQLIDDPTYRKTILEQANCIISAYQSKSMVEKLLAIHTVAQDSGEYLTDILLACLSHAKASIHSNSSSRLFCAKLLDSLSGVNANYNKKNIIQNLILLS